MTHGGARRRLLSGAALVGVGLVFAMPRVEAQAALPTTWTGSKPTTAASTAAQNVAITAEWHHTGKVTVNTWLTTPAGLPIGCTDAGEAKLVTSTSTDAAQKITTSSASTVLPCNGTYGYRLDGQVPNLLGPPDDLPLSGSIDVVVTPPPVTGVTASPAGDTSVALSWSPAANPAPDFLGYQVERQGANGQWTKVGSVGADAHTFTDTSAPTGAAVSYRVLGRRSGPHGELLSDDGGHASATLPTTTTSSTAPPSTSSSTPGTPGSTPGTGGTTGGTKTPTTKGPANKGQTGIGVTAPRLGAAGTTTFPALPGDDSSGSTDYQPQLQYGTSTTADGLGGSSSEDGGLSSAFYEPGSGRGMAVPVATGFVLAAWAFHLRFLARAARPAKVTAPRGRRFS